MKRKHETPQNALADIALLLLIFFLITTQFPKEEGVKTTLPPMTLQPVSQEYEEIEIWLNAMDQVMLNGQLTDIGEVSNRIYHNLSKKSTNTRINLKSHVNASYVAYVQVYDEVKKAYKQWYEKESITRFGKSFHLLNAQEKNTLQKEHPIEIFEGDLVH